MLVLYSQDIVSVYRYICCTHMDVYTCIYVCECIFLCVDINQNIYVYVYIHVLYVYHMICIYSVHVISKSHLNKHRFRIHRISYMDTVYATCVSLYKS